MLLFSGSDICHRLVVAVVAWALWCYASAVAWRPRAPSGMRVRTNCSCRASNCASSPRKVARYHRNFNVRRFPKSCDGYYASLADDEKVEARFSGHSALEKCEYSCHLRRAQRLFVKGESYRALTTPRAGVSRARCTSAASAASRRTARVAHPQSVSASLACRDNLQKISK